MCILSNLLVEARGTHSNDGSWKPSLQIFKSKTMSLTTAGIWFLEWGEYDFYSSNNMEMLRLPQ